MLDGVSIGEMSVMNSKVGDSKIIFLALSKLPKSTLVVNLCSGELTTSTLASSVSFTDDRPSAVKRCRISDSKSAAIASRLIFGFASIGFQRNGADCLRTTAARFLISVTQSVTSSGFR